MEAVTNLAQINLVGVHDEETGIVILSPNMTRALEMLEIGTQNDYPVANHLLGEIAHFRYSEVNDFYLEKFNLITGSKRC
jgi:hypothetical protein